MTKHIKFEENIEGDEAYRTSFKSRKHFVNKNVEYEDDGLDDGHSTTRKWHEQIPEEPHDFKPLAQEQVNALIKEAKSVIHGESLAHETKVNKVGSSDQKWARSLLSKGAMADRVAAATVLIQDSPIHNLSILQNFVAMVKPAKKKDSLIAIETLTELFIGDLLLPERKLRKFEQRPLSELEKMCSGNKDHRKKILLYWIYEDILKETYGEFVKSLNTFAHDSVETHKEKAVSAMAKLLMGNPELEKVLLTNIVNKLGDPSQKVASKVIYQLSQVLYNHPNMKGVVLNEIEKMLFRPNISPKAQYYGICFLNQFYLNKDDSKVAENLVRVYFSFFKACIKTGEVDTRLMGGILTGVRRCRPFLRDEAVQALQTHSYALHKLVHLASYTIALQALALLFQLGATDRYYNSLYKKLGHPETLTTTHPALLLNLVYRSLTNDENEPRVLAFFKRLLQLAVMSDANRACAILLVVSRLSRRRKLPLFKEKEEIPEPKIEKSESDEVVGETEANGKMVEENETDEGEKSGRKMKKSKRKKDLEGDSNEDGKKNVDSSKGSKTSWLIGDKLDLLNDEDDDEVYHDIPLEEDQEDHKKKIKNLMRKKKESSRGWLFCDVTKENTEVKEEEDEQADVENALEGRKIHDKEKNLEILIKKSKNMEKIITEYCPYNRNPSYCGAEHSVMTELLLLKEHYHPTVRLFAEKIVEGSINQYNGDPVKDFSVTQFLDRFAFKNPKKDLCKSTEEETGQQGVKIRGSHPKFAVRRNYVPGGLRSIRVNSSAYLNVDAAYIPVDERFLYDYLQMRRQRRGDTGDDESGAESDSGSINSEDFNAYMDSITGTKKGLEEPDEEVEEEDVDYMREMVAHRKVEATKKKNLKREDDQAQDEEDSAGEQDLQDDDDLDSLGSADLDGDDESDLMLSDEDDMDDDEAQLESKFGKCKKKGRKADDSDDDIFSENDDIMLPQPKAKGKSKAEKKGIESMFASAEEFATLLEDTGSSRKQGTSQAVSTQDNANVKQLDWEERRDRWVKGYSGNKNKPRGPAGDKGNFNRGRGNSNKGGNFGKKRKDFGGGKGGPKKKFKK